MVTAHAKQDMAKLVLMLMQFFPDQRQMLILWIGPHTHKENAWIELTAVERYP